EETQGTERFSRRCRACPTCHDTLPQTRERTGTHNECQGSVRRRTLSGRAGVPAGLLSTWAFDRAAPSLGNYSEHDRKVLRAQDEKNDRLTEGRGAVPTAYLKGPNGRFGPFWNIKMMSARFRSSVAASIRPEGDPPASAARAASSRPVSDCWRFSDFWRSASARTPAGAIRGSAGVAGLLCVRPPGINALADRQAATASATIGRRRPIRETRTKAIRMVAPSTAPQCAPMADQQRRLPL